MTVQEDFALWLRQRLDERRISQRQLAYRAGVDHTTICRLLSGERQPTHRTAQRLASVLDDAGSSPARLQALLRTDPLLGEHDVTRIVSLYLATRAERAAEARARARRSDGVRSHAD